MARRRRRGVVGLIAAALALAAGAALARNEWRLASRLGALDAAADRVATLDPALSPPDADPARPVWLSGPARAEGRLSDPLFPTVSADGLRLDRLAETRQWREIRENRGGDRNTRYEQVWSAVPIDSALFQDRAGHANPTPLPLEPASLPAGDARLGRHRLAPELLAPLPATSRLEPGGSGPVTDTSGRRFNPAGDWLTTGDPAPPRVGDVRVRWAYAPEGTVSVVGAHDGEAVVPWRAPSGAAVALAARGEVPPEDLLGAAGREAWGGAWLHRLLAAGGLTLLFLIASPALAGLVPAFEGARVRSRLAIAATLAVAWTVAACGLGRLAAQALTHTTGS